MSAKDQYGKLIPDDLVLLENCDEALLRARRIEGLDWYCLEGKSEIYVSSDELTKIIGSHDFISIKDVYVNVPKELIMVDRPLRRWNIRDGFYNA